MKVVLFCGGFGMRMGSFFQNKARFFENSPKPMLLIGNRPILWHLMKYYAHFGHRDFILCLGYKADIIKEYFKANNDYFADWNIQLVDTGLNTKIGQRLFSVKDLLQNDDVFMVNYTDGLSDVDLNAYLDYFIKHDKVASLLSVKAPLGFHHVISNKNGIVENINDGLGNYDLRINAGFFIFKNEFFNYIKDGEELVDEPFERLIRQRQLISYIYDGFWKNIDNYKDKIEIDEMYEKNNSPWILWED
jgi:glucose-1-phosphate cytidylyltransferase